MKNTYIIPGTLLKGNTIHYFLISEDYSISFDSFNNIFLKNLDGRGLNKHYYDTQINTLVYSI